MSILKSYAPSKNVILQLGQTYIVRPYDKKISAWLLFPSNGYQENIGWKVAKVT